MEQLEINLAAKQADTFVVIADGPTGVALKQQGFYIEYYHPHYMEWYACHPTKNYDFTTLAKEGRLRYDSSRIVRVFQLVKREDVGPFGKKIIAYVQYAKTVDDLKLLRLQQKAEGVGTLEYGVFPKETMFL